MISEYTKVYSDGIKTDDLRYVTPAMIVIIEKAMQQRLVMDPFACGKVLRYSFKGLMSLRVGNYRVIYAVSRAESLVTVLVILHRKEVYERLGVLLRKRLTRDV